MNALSNFLQHHTLAFSTLSPVHIGCGDDYIPTNYVVDDEVLYSFDSSLLASVLNDTERNQLKELVKHPSGLQGIQRFIYQLRHKLAPMAEHRVILAPAVAQHYHSKVGQVVQHERSLNRINVLQIERTAYNEHSQAPILPGSSLKGAIRTALLNAINQKKPVHFDTVRMPKDSNPAHNKAGGKLEKQLFQGSFASDPMRLFKIADAYWTPSEGSIAPRVMFDNNLSKNPLKLDTERKATSSISTRREVLPAMNHRCFAGQLSIQRMGDLINCQKTTRNGKGEALSPKQELNFNQLIDDCNQFYCDLFEQELKVHQRLDCLDPTWLALMQDLLRHELGDLMKQRKAMLLRVGRHSGAEGVTIEGARHIKIMLGKRETVYSSGATTLWMAADYEKSTKNLMPFGWVLVEIDPNDDAISRTLQQKLKAFNVQQWRKEQALSAELADKFAQAQQLLIVVEQEAEQRRMEAEKQRVEAEKKAEEQRIKAEQEAEKQRMEAERLAKLSPLCQALEGLVQRKESGEGLRQGPGCALATELAALCEQEGWTAQERQDYYPKLLELLQHMGIDRKKNAKWKKRLADFKAE